MEITKENWNKSTVDELLLSLSEADYIALDTELTGIDIKSKSFIEDMTERYLKLSKTSAKYSIMQLGLCTFKLRSENTDTSHQLNYDVKPYNIYIFPEEYCEKTVQLEVSAIYFNSKYNFDFNKWMKQGISFTNSNGLDREIKYFKEKNLNNFKSTSPMILNREEDKQRLSHWNNSLAEFMSNPNETELTLDRPVKFFMYYFIETLSVDMKENLYFEEDFIEVIETGKVKPLLRIKKVKGKEEKEQMITNFIEKEMPGHLSTKKGAKVIYDALVENKSKIFGHNCILDFMFLINHFDRSLPSGTNCLNEFKGMLAGLFAEVYDTKYMFVNFSKQLSLSGNNQSNLESMYKFLRDNFNKTSEGEDIIKFNLSHKNHINNRYSDSSVNSFHEAAFDAYVTGCAFLIMINKLGEDWRKGTIGKFFTMQSLYGCMDIYRTKQDLLENEKASFFGILIRKENNFSVVSFKEVITYLESESLSFKMHKDSAQQAMIFIVEWGSDPQQKSIQLYHLLDSINSKVTLSPQSEMNFDLKYFDIYGDLTSMYDGIRLKKK